MLNRILKRAVIHERYEQAGRLKDELQSLNTLLMQVRALYARAHARSHTICLHHQRACQRLSKACVQNVHICCWQHGRASFVLPSLHAMRLLGGHAIPTSASWWQALETKRTDRQALVCVCVCGGGGLAGAGEQRAGAGGGVARADGHVGVAPAAPQPHVKRPPRARAHSHARACGCT